MTIGLWIAAIIGYTALAAGFTLLLRRWSNEPHLRRCHHCHLWYGGPYREHAGRMHKHAA